MGGMLAMYVSNRLSTLDDQSWVERHHGTVLIAPALSVNIPSRAVVLLLQAVVVPLASKQLMPQWVSKSSKPEPEYQYKDPKFAYMTELDDWHRFPGDGLAWKQNMRWG